MVSTSARVYMAVAVAMALMSSMFVSTVSMRTCASHTDCDSESTCHFAYDGASHVPSIGYCISHAQMAAAASNLAADPEGGANVAATLDFMEMDESLSMGNGTKEEKKETTEKAAPAVAAPAAGGIGEMTSLSVKAAAGYSGNLVLGAPADRAFSVGVDGKQESFSFAQGGKAYLSITKEGDIVARTKKLSTGGQMSVSAGKTFMVGETPQWGMLHEDVFQLGKDNGIKGWKAEAELTPAKAVNAEAITRCGGVTMLGGAEKFTSGGITKVFGNLTSHRFVRVVAIFHVIDKWDGETAFMKLSNGLDGAPEYAWTHVFDSRPPNAAETAINVCGSETVGETYFSNVVDVSVRHESDKLEVNFGTTLPEHAEAYWGLSSVKIYVR